jgi:hypothetical protein
VVIKSVKTGVAWEGDGLDCVMSGWVRLCNVSARAQRVIIHLMISSNRHVGISGCSTLQIMRFE